MKWFFLYVIEGFAVIWDCYDRRIPNFLLISGLLTGISCQWCNAQLEGMIQFFSGVALPFLALCVLHYFKMLGAGDIKLLMTAGGFLGPILILKTLCVSFLIAAVFSVVILFKHRILIRRLEYFFRYLQQYFKTGIWSPYILQEKNEAYLHFALPVFLATILVTGGFL